MVVLNSDGSLRYVVGTGSGTCGTIYDILYRAGGRIMVGGAVNCWMGEQCRYAEALLPNAEIDLTFDLGTGANGYVGAVAVAADGRIYIGGEFTRYNGIVRRGLAVLHPDGTLDDEEGTGLGFNGVVRALSILPDGRYYVGAVSHAFKVLSGKPWHALGLTTCWIQSSCLGSQSRHIASMYCKMGASLSAARYPLTAALQVSDC